MRSSRDDRGRIVGRHRLVVAHRDSVRPTGKSPGPALSTSTARRWAATKWSLAASQRSRSRTAGREHAAACSP